MFPYNAIMDRWNSRTRVPLFVGAAPEGTKEPYATMNVVQSNPVILAPRIAVWNESLLQVSLHAARLEDIELYAGPIRTGFRFYSSEEIADVILMNSGADYNKQPALSGNRGWVESMEFKIIH